jgi:uncharacterized membrane protein YoaK (UPF0700 family)
MKNINRALFEDNANTIPGALLGAAVGSGVGAWVGEPLLCFSVALPIGIVVAAFMTHAIDQH